MTEPNEATLLSVRTPCPHCYPRMVSKRTVTFGGEVPGVLQNVPSCSKCNNAWIKHEVTLADVAKFVAQHQAAVADSG